MENAMEMILMIGGVVVPTLSAVGGLGAWALRRMDRRFDEAALDRRRIEMQLGERCDGLEAASKADFNRLEAASKADFNRLEAAFKADFKRLEADLKRLEADFKARSDRLEQRIDRVAGQLTDQIVGLNLEVGKAQGAARVAVEAASA